MIGEECVLEFFQGLESRGQGQGLNSQGQGQDQGQYQERTILLDNYRHNTRYLQD